MDAAALNAITDVEVLRGLVREQLETIAERDHTIRVRDLKIDKLNHELARLRRMQFAAKAERMDPAQRELFDEAMAADIAALEAELAEIQSPEQKAKAPRRKPHRRSLPADLPREEVVHEPEHDHCARCQGELVKIGEHVSEKLDVIPMQFKVRRDVYPQYACRACEMIVAEPVAPGDPRWWHGRTRAARAGRDPEVRRSPAAIPARGDLRAPRP